LSPAVDGTLIDTDEKSDDSAPTPERPPLQRQPDTALVSASDLAEGSLPKDSLVKLTKFFTMHEALVRRGTAWAGKASWTSGSRAPRLVERGLRFVLCT